MVRVIRDEGLLENARVMGQRLRTGLEAIAAMTPHIGDVRGMGLLQGIEFVEDAESLAPRAGAAARVTAAARDRQLMIYSCPTALGSSVLETVLLAPPLNITSTDVDQILDRLSDAIGAA
jgi:4-aminobutyrate aminotransferase-like enzyme